MNEVFTRRRPDPFSPYFGFKRRQRTQLRNAAIAGVFVLAFITWKVATHGIYEVRVGDETLFYAGSDRDIYRILDEMLKEEGKDARFEQAITVRKVREKRPLTSPEDARKILKEKVHPVIPAKVLVVGGATKAAFRDETAVRVLLEGMPETFCGEFLDPPFQSNYKHPWTIEDAFLPASRVRSVEQLKLYLFPKNSDPKLPIICKKQKEVFEDIPFKTVTQKDSSLYTGVRQVVQEGVPGRRKVEVLLTYENRKQVEKKVLKSEVVFPAREKRVKEGTRPRISAARKRSNAAFLARKIYQQYRRGNHKGRFRGVYGMEELGVSVPVAHSLNHAFGAHFAHGLSWSRIVAYLKRGDHSFGGRWGCSGGPHDTEGAARWIARNL